MIFNPSPALHKIRQLVRLISKDPIPRRPCWKTPWPDQDLPDPEQFVDSSVKRNTAASVQAGAHAQRKRAKRPARYVR